MRIDVQRCESGLSLVFTTEGGGTVAFSITADQARALATELYDAAAAADPVGHQTLIDATAQQIGRGFAEGLLMRAPTRGAH